MRPDAAFKRLLERYGQSVEVHYRDEPVGAPCRAFVQPILERKEQELPSPLGWAGQKRWLYLGDPEAPLEGLEDGYLVWQGRRFEIVRAQAVRVGARVSHWWAVLRERERE